MFTWLRRLLQNPLKLLRATTAHTASRNLEPESRIASPPEVETMRRIEFVCGPFDGLHAYLDAGEESPSFLRLPVSRGTLLQLEGQDAPLPDEPTSLAIYQLCVRESTWHYRFRGQVSPTAEPNSPSPP